MTLAMTLSSSGRHRGHGRSPSGDQPLPRRCAEPSGSTRDDTAATGGPPAATSRSLVAARTPPGPTRDDTAATGGPPAATSRSLVAARNPPGPTRDDTAATGGPPAATSRSLVAAR